MVSYRGGGGGGSRLEFPPPPRNLEIEYDYYCGAINISYLTSHVIGHKYMCVIKMLFGKFVPDCVRSNLRGSKFEIFSGRHALRPS